MPSFLSSLLSKLETEFPLARVLVVDDGSGPDEQAGMQTVVESTRKAHPSLLELLPLAENVGKGGAILAGWEQATGADYVGFVDADGAVPASEVCRVAGMLEHGGHGPALFASRIKMLGRTVSRSGVRHLTGRLFAFMVGSCIEPAVYDSQCGLKFVPEKALSRIRPWLKGRRFSFDVELLAALRTIQYPVLEVPVDWSDVPGSKVSMVRDTRRMLIDLVRIKREMRSWT